MLTEEQIEERVKEIATHGYRVVTGIPQESPTAGRFYMIGVGAAYKTMLAMLCDNDIERALVERVATRMAKVVLADDLTEKGEHST